MGIPFTWIGSPNFSVGRQGYKPEAIVIHVMEGSIASCDSWFHSEVSKVSAHYGLGKNGEVHKYVLEANTAWHAGRVDKPSWCKIKEGVNPNLYTIGIEHEGLADSIWPESLYKLSARLIRDLCTRHGIPIDRNHIVGHHEIYSPKTCPGKGDVDLLVSMARNVR